MVLFSCAENDLKKVAAINNEKESPVVVMENAEIEFSDSAIIKAKVAGGRIENYVYYNDENEVEDQKLVMTERVRARFYDNKGEITSILTAQRAVRFENEHKTEMEGDVVVVNTAGDSLTTEFLLWDEEKNTISSDKNVRVKTKNEIIFAEGFESDINFQEYTFEKVTGTITL